MNAVTDVDEVNIEEAAIQAEKVYSLIAARNKLLGGHIFHDPAWAMLLDLFIAHHGGRKLSISDVCVGAQSPLATCLRYISILSDAGLVTRENDPEDRRRVHVTLTEKAITVLVTLLDKDSNRLRECSVAFDHGDSGIPLPDFDRYLLAMTGRGIDDRP